MKIAGIILAIFGGLLILSSLNLAITKYNFQDTHDISMFAGGLAFSIFILVAGFALIKKAKGQ